MKRASEALRMRSTLKMAASFSSRTAAVARSLWIKYRVLEKPRIASGVSAALQVGKCSSAAGGAVVESSEEFHYVQRLIPPSLIPDPPKHSGTTPSGWTPPAESPPSLSYMIRRSRLHNVPVYLDVREGNRRTTLVRKVEGDIWALNEDLKHFLQGLTGRDTPTQVNEVTMSIRVKGTFDKELKDWIIKQGF